MHDINQPILKKDWSKPIDGVIDIPEDLMPLFNKLGMQLMFIQFSGKNEIIALAHMVQLAEEFFTKVKYEKSN